MPWKRIFNDLFHDFLDHKGRDEKRILEDDVVQFLNLAESIAINDPETREVWMYLLEAVKSCRDSTPGLMLEMLNTLDGGAGRIGFNELFLDELSGDSDRAEMYYLAFEKSTITCSKQKLLDAYHELIKILPQKFLDLIPRQN
jgi:hypothetical protein